MCALLFLATVPSGFIQSPFPAERIQALETGIAKLNSTTAILALTLGNLKNMAKEPKELPEESGSSFRLWTALTERRANGENNCWDLHELEALDASGNKMTISDSNVITSGQTSSFPKARLVDGNEGNIWGGRPDAKDCTGQAITEAGCSACPCAQFVGLTGLTPNPVAMRVKQGQFSSNKCNPRLPLYVQKQLPSGEWQELRKISSGWTVGWNSVSLTAA